MIRLLVIGFSLGLAMGKTNPKFLEGCGGWRHCLETHHGSEAPLVWFEGWNATLQTKLDQLLVTSEGQQEGWSKDNGLLIVTSGDSTVIQQFQVLSEFVRLRSDFHEVQGRNAERQKKYELTFGGPRGTPGSVTFVFYRIFEACMLQSVNPHVQQAYALYFGCGMHLLHLLPTQGPSMLKLALESWTNYETLLTSRVDSFRQVNPNIKLVFTSTHAIEESSYFGEWLDALKGYEARDPFYLGACKKKFDELLPAESPVRNNVERACIDTVFGAHGVELLNKRGLAAMEQVGVPVVPAHMLVAGQKWATPDGDGRHYPYLVPLELFWFLNTLEGLP